MEATSPTGATDVAAPAPEDVPFCPDCGYDLRGSGGSDRCPECGLTIDRERLGVSRIPWSHRRQIGRVRAYWRTVLLATFRTRTLAAEVTRPVDYRDAQRFRLVTALIASLTVLTVLIVGVVVLEENPFAEASRAYEGLLQLPFLPARPRPAGLLDAAFPLIAGATVPPVVPLGIVLLAVMVTGVGSYWFHPRSQPVVRQNRAVALSYYACAPLAFLPVPALIVIVLMGITAETPRGTAAATRPFLLLVLLVYLLTPLIVLSFYVATLRLLRGAAAASTGRMWLATFAIPVTWLLCAAVALLALPWAVGFVRLVVDSLR